MPDEQIPESPVPDKLEVRFSGGRDQIFTAMAKARKTFKPVLRKSKNPFFKSKYADLAEILDATVESLSDNGLSVMQFPSMDMQGHVVIITVLGHSSGQWAEGRLPMPISKMTPQEVGSVITYGRRYSIGSLLNVASEDDDDAEAAMDRTTEKVEKAEEAFQQRDGAQRAGSKLVDAAKEVFKNSGKTEKQLGDYLRVRFSAERPDQLTSQEISELVKWLSGKEEIQETLIASVAAAQDERTDPKPPQRLQTGTVGRTGVTEKQLGRLYAISKAHSVSEEDIHIFIKEQFSGMTSTKDLSRAEYDILCKWMEAQ